MDLLEKYEADGCLRSIAEQKKLCIIFSLVHLEQCLDAILQLCIGTKKIQNKTAINIHTTADTTLVAYSF
jgi:hypothetical protein